MVHTQFSRVQKQDLTVSLTDPVHQGALYSMERKPGVLYAEGRRVVAVELVKGHRQWRTALTGIPADHQLQFVVDEHLNDVAIPPAGLLLTDFRQPGFDQPGAGKRGKGLPRSARDTTGDGYQYTPGNARQFF